MNQVKLRLLIALFSWFGRCAPATRQRVGAALAWVTRTFAGSRMRIVRRNLELCFPDVDPTQRETWTRAHVRALAQSFVDRGVLWFGTEAAIRDMVTLTGYEHMQARLDDGTPMILLAPHFVGLDAAATVLTMHTPSGATMYTPQSDPAIDEIVRRGRARFNDTRLVSRKEGVRGLIRHLREGRPIYYLPDMDFGRQGAVFVPFYGIATATIPATAQIARKWGADVLPILERWDPATGRYHVRVCPPLPDFPGDASLEEATARLNRLLEEWINVDPAQYYWVHRRFKTRPAGEAKLY